MDKIILAFFLMLLTLGNAHAAEEKEFVYSPEGCDFSVTFPQEPGNGRRCPSDPDLPCEEVARFTEIYSLKSSITAEMSCKVISEDVRKTYNKDVLETLLRGMARNAKPDEMGVFYKDMPNEKVQIAAISGMKDTGYTPAIYTAQIWVGEHSLLVFEGTLAGPENKTADDAFAKILGSLMLKETEDVKKAKEEAKED